MQLSAVINFIAAALACSDDGDGRFDNRIAEYIQRNSLHQRSIEGSHVPIEQGIRPLQWGDINFVHVTDTHGWLSGHPDQEQYSADWGDLVSFIKHIKDIGNKRGVDTLVIETGDRHDGTGLSDATKLDGNVSQPLFAQQGFDILSMGNHELYKRAVALQEYNLLRPYYGDHYLSSNIELQIDGQWVPAGAKYRKFETKYRKARILAFGFIFDFKGFDNGTRVIPVEEEIKKDWFKNVLAAGDYDLILVTGHVPVRGFEEFGHIVDAIREINPTVPIQGFGGHTHLRDYRVFDDNAVALESGRYLETIGWASVTLPDSVNGTAEFNRRYIDFNAANFAYHTGTSLNTTISAPANSSQGFDYGPEQPPAPVPQRSFYTPKGNAISEAIAKARANLTLDKQLAYVDKDYWTNRAEYPGPDSIFTLAEKFMQLLKGNVSRDDKPRYIVTNSGNFRYDLIAGPYTEDKKYIVSPFTNDWLYLEDVPKNLAEGLMNHLNNDYSYLRKRDFDWNYGKELNKREDVPGAVAAETSLIAPVPAATGTPYIPTQQLYKGYVTKDDAGSDGDDTPHDGYKIYDVPNAIAGIQNVDNSTETVDFIFVSFLLKNVVSYSKDNGGPSVAKPYGGKYVRDLLAEYFAQKS